MIRPITLRTFTIIVMRWSMVIVGTCLLSRVAFTGNLSGYDNVVDLGYSMPQSE